jgi:ABC-type spermidine/putrescine transport system permease subunit II
MQEVLDCAFRNAPGAIGTLVRLAVLTAGIALVGVVAGIVLALLAVHWLRRGARPVAATVLIGLAVALVVPTIWLAANFVGSVVLG